MPPTRPDRSEPGESPAVRLARDAAELAGSARRHLDLYSHDLPADVYATEAFCEAIKQLVIEAPRHARIRILVADTRPAARGHALVTLGQTLSSAIEFRTPAPGAASWFAECLIADAARGLTQHERRALTPPQSLGPPEARKLHGEFEARWQAAQTASDLRRLYLGG